MHPHRSGLAPPDFFNHSDTAMNKTSTEAPTRAPTLPRAQSLMLSQERWTMIIEALDEKAHMDAGHSQHPHLFAPSDTAEYGLARQLEQLLGRTP
jgi:hypothetical protein